MANSAQSIQDSLKRAVSPEASGTKTKGPSAQSASDPDEIVGHLHREANKIAGNPEVNTIRTPLL